MWGLSAQDAADKIIQNAQLVTVRGRGDAEAPIVKEEFKHTFKKHGTYFSNGRSLNFLAIWNDAFPQFPSKLFRHPTVRGASDLSATEEPMKNPFSSLEFAYEKQKNLEPEEKAF